MCSSLDICTVAYVASGTLEAYSIEAKKAPAGREIRDVLYDVKSPDLKLVLMRSGWEGFGF